MSLGSDNKVCKEEFVNAMRARLIAEDPKLGVNVDLPSVNQNLGALGQAVFLIATTHAETVSDKATDTDFWKWITEVNTWLTALSNWQAGITNAFTAYAPLRPEEQALKNAVLGLSSPGSPPARVPTSQRGKIK